jgi:hypothetical protein
MERRYYLLEILFAPVVIALVGTLGTYFINDRLEDAATKRAEADRQIKILEMFADKVNSNDETQQRLALNLLTVLDPKLAKDIADAVSVSSPNQSAVKKVALQVAEDASARARDIPRIYLHIRNKENQIAARSIGENLRKTDFAVPGIELVEEGPSTSELRYFRKEDQPDAERIVKKLKEIRVVVSPKDFSGSYNPKTISPRLYELWFAPGEPKGALQ